MRAVRFTKPEREFLERVLAESPAPPGSPAERKLLAIKDKLRVAQEPKPASVNVGPIEDALVRTSRGRVVKLAGSCARKTPGC